MSKTGPTEADAWICLAWPPRPMSKGGNASVRSERLGEPAPHATPTPTPARNCTSEPAGAGSPRVADAAPSLPAEADDEIAPSSSRDHGSQTATSSSSRSAADVPSSP